MKKQGSLLGVLLILLFFSMSNHIFAFGSSAGNTKVYLICQPEEVTQEIYLFADDQFLAVLKKGTYFLANINPGIHFIWSSDGYNAFRVNEFEFIPGQTYYINIGNNGCHSLLNQMNGTQLLQRVNKIKPIIDDQIKKCAADISEKFYTTKMIRPEKSITSIIKKIPAHKGPTDIKIARFTPIKLSFKDNVSSNINKIDDVTWLQVSEDVVINDKVCIAKGTLVKGLFWDVVPPPGYGLPGFIDIIIPEIQINENTSIPVIGRYIISGIPNVAEAAVKVNAGINGGISDAGAVERFRHGIAGGLLGGLLGSDIASTIKGKDAIVLAGEEVIIWTRNESWINF